MEVDRQAPVVGESEIEVLAPAEMAWDVLADFERWPDWNSAVAWVKGSGPAADGVEFKWKSGPATITSKVERAERPSFLGWTGKAPGTRAIHVWHFEQRGGACHLRTEESMDGWLVKLMRSRVQKVLQSGLDDTLGRLKAEAERRAAG